MPNAGDLPDPVVSTCREWLSLIDTAAPGLVTGLYLRGGLSMGEWVPGCSEIDFVATLRHRPGDHELDALRASHAALSRTRPDLPFDGVHVLADDLTRDPDLCPEVPCVLHGYFEESGRADLNPVAWHELATGGVAVRGPGPDELRVWTDRDRLVEFTRENLADYWAANATALAAMPREAEDPATCCWCVLGVARLHHLLAVGSTTTKSGAGRWALTAYPEHHHRVVREALRVREGGPEQYPDDAAGRGLDTAALVAYVVHVAAATGR